MTVIAFDTGLYTEPQQAADWIYNLLSENAGEVGLAYVGLNERLNPRYPAAQVIPGLRSKVPHATHKFQVGMEVGIFVLHARLDKSHSTRTREDLALVTSIENLIETGEMDMDGNVIFAYVSETTPGRVNRPTGESVVGTHMVVSVISQKGFPSGA